MVRTIEQLDSGLTLGHVGLGYHGTTIGSVPLIIVTKPLPGNVLWLAKPADR